MSLSIRKTQREDDPIEIDPSCMIDFIVMKECGRGSPQVKHDSSLKMVINDIKLLRGTKVRRPRTADGITILLVFNLVTRRKSC